MKTSTRESYMERIENVITYLTNHLDESLDLYRLADEACLSPYHFHRIYLALMGETVAETIRRLRLQRAAANLLTSEVPMTKLATAAGYSSVQAFTRAFRDTYGIAPATYRKRGGLTAAPNSVAPNFKVESSIQNAKVQHFKPQTVLALTHRGDYMKIDQTFEKLIIWADRHHLLGPLTRVFGVYHDDPTITSVSKLRSDACITVSTTIPTEGDFHITQTPGGHCAVLSHAGPYTELNNAFNNIYTGWLPGSGYEPDDQPCFSEHLSNPRITPPAQLRTLVYMPLKLQQ